MASTEETTHSFLLEMSKDLGISPQTLDRIDFVGAGDDLPSIYRVTDFASAAVGLAGAAVADLLGVQFGANQRVTVNRRLASLWFGFSFRPDGWTLPPLWNAIAGDYQTSDGWIRLHTNVPHHEAAALAVLNVPSDKAEVSRALLQWKAEDLESAIVANKGCAAAMRSCGEWNAHPQGQSLSDEPLWRNREMPDGNSTVLNPTPSRPLQGVRVLDLTRVLAGPVATRFLAGLGADVLRIDPPTWDEPGVIPDVSLGKRCARLDLRSNSGLALIKGLLAKADILVHGYRADALEGLGLGAETLREIRPGLIDISLNAYGWSGPWRNRRGFDSLVQMSCGIAEAGMRVLGKNRPTPLPVQALDHVTGYLLAAGAIRGLTVRMNHGRGFEAKTSLARVAQMLVSSPLGSLSKSFSLADDDEYFRQIEATDFGPGHRLLPPVKMGETRLRWDRPAAKLGSSEPVWLT